MPKKTEDKKRMMDTLIGVVDGWKNILTGLGIRGRDKRLSAFAQVEFLSKGGVESLYQTDDVAARIIDRPPEEMMREGYEIKILDGNEELAIEGMKELAKFRVNRKLLWAMKLSRLYGGAGIVIGIPNQKPQDPLDLAKVNSIDFFIVLDRHRLTASGLLNRDPTSENFGMPDHYSIDASEVQGEKIGGNTSMIHHSRIVRFNGVELPRDLMTSNSNWGDSILSRLVRLILNFQTGYESMATLLQDFSQAVFKIKDLDKMIAMGSEDLVTKRLELLTLVGSVVNAFVIQEGEEYERKTTNVSGLDKLLDKLGTRLVAATDIPHTILLGESPSGMGATGDSEKRDFFDHIKARQEAILEPALRTILDVIYANKSGPGKGTIPEYKIVFNSLWQLTQKDQAEIRKLMSEADERYINTGVLSIDEVAESRFDPDGFSVDTILDAENRDLLGSGHDEDENKDK